MRIISGQLGGRTIRVPGGAVRPTQDKVREAIFSSLAPLIPGARVLDLFSGSGAMGLEAWSRGASAVCWVEQNRSVFRTLQQNVRELCGDSPKVRCECADAFFFLRRENGAEYDVVFCDPPYEKNAGSGRIDQLLNLLGCSPSLPSGALLVYEHGGAETPADSPLWELKRSRRYGKTGVDIYQKVNERRDHGEH